MFQFKLYENDLERMPVYNSRKGQTLCPDCILHVPAPVKGVWCWVSTNPAGHTGSYFTGKVLSSFPSDFHPAALPGRLTTHPETHEYVNPRIIATIGSHHCSLFAVISHSGSCISRPQLFCSSAHFPERLKTDIVDVPRSCDPIQCRKLLQSVQVFSPL